MKSGRFHVKSTYKPYKSSNSRKILQFHGVLWEGYVMFFTWNLLDFMNMSFWVITKCRSFFRKTKHLVVDLLNKFNRSSILCNIFIEIKLPHLCRLWVESILSMCNAMTVIHSIPREHSTSNCSIHPLFGTLKRSWTFLYSKVLFSSFKDRNLTFIWLIILNLNCCYSLNLFSSITLTKSLHLDISYCSTSLEIGLSTRCWNCGEYSVYAYFLVKWHILSLVYLNIPFTINEKQAVKSKYKKNMD